MIKNNKGKIEVIGDSALVLSEIEQLVMKAKELIKDDEVLKMVFDSDLLAMCLARDEKEFIKNNGEADKEKLLKKIDKIYKFIEENGK